MCPIPLQDTPKACPMAKKKKKKITNLMKDFCESRLRV